MALPSTIEIKFHRIDSQVYSEPHMSLLIWKQQVRQIVGEASQIGLDTV